jgi:hypothetical protein
MDLGCHCRHLAIISPDIFFFATMQSMYIIKKKEFVVQDNEMWPRMQAARYGRNPATCT